RAVVARPCHPRNRPRVAGDASLHALIECAHRVPPRRAKMSASAHCIKIVIALACAAPVIAVTSADAQARRGVKPYYSESYETPGPQHGYEGYVAPNYYCSYKRFPNRECTTSSSGKRSCRVVSWRLEQTCQ